MIYLLSDLTPKFSGGRIHLFFISYLTNYLSEWSRTDLPTARSICKMGEGMAFIIWLQVPKLHLLLYSVYIPVMSISV